MTTFKLICFLTIISSAHFHESENGYVENNFVDSICDNENNCPIENSVCIEKVCKCREGFIIDGSLTKCLKVATAYNEECAESVQCSKFLSAGGSCKNGVCVCSDGYHYLHGVCHLSKGLNNPCEKDDDCFVHTDYAAASCIEGVCKCSEGFYQREYNTCRRKALGIDSDCIVDSDCFFDEKAKCVSDKCILPEDKPLGPESGNSVEVFEDVEEQTISEPMITVGSDCQINDDCTSLNNSHCNIEKRCACNRAYYSSDDSTHCIPEIGEKCDNTIAAMIDKTVCKDGLWTCEYVYVGVKSNKLCRKMLRNIGGKCIYPEQCQLFGPRAECVNNLCVCNAASHWVESESFCWLNKKIQESCESDKDCDQPEGSPKVVCKSNGDQTKFCSCPEATHENDEKSYCLQDKPELGSFCQNDEDCTSLSNALCSDKKCQCKSNYFESDKGCLAGLYASCRTTDDCKKLNTVCDNETKVCQCSEEFVKTPENQCVKKSSYQQQCDYDAQCSSVTSNTYCAFENESEKKSHANLNTERKHGSCQCLAKHFYNMNSCFMKKNLGEECSKQGECFVTDSKAVCRNGICVCEFGLKFNGKQCVNVSSAPLAMSIQMWLFLLPAIFLAMKALR